MFKYFYKIDLNIACLEYYVWNSSVSLVSPTKSRKSKELYLIINAYFTLHLFPRILVIIEQFVHPLLLNVTL